jgi:hypothetical protein
MATTLTLQQMKEIVRDHFEDFVNKRDCLRHAPSSSDGKWLRMKREDFVKVAEDVLDSLPEEFAAASTTSRFSSRIFRPTSPQTNLDGKGDCF